MDIMTVIMTAFPGQFTYKELLNFDIRELQFWSIRAQKTLLQSQLKMLLMSRAAMGESDSFNSIRNEIEMRIREMDIGREAIVKEAWSSIRETERIR